ncbi:MPN domain-containing protein [Meloidogyne graminicola]|uniref:COP9 signalosome complex subunit 6 n=1 Tax=Meloidogyne graminicola TaxID=189291 RepID=A0A8T0A1V6_9BILA|nr:MPN domain-containing protein [Meloidogyne graminicola]
MAQHKVNITLSNISALIHPVVVLNISDQWTRAIVQNDQSKIVCGALLGKQSSKDIEIWNSFELRSSFVDNQLILDEEYFVQRNLLFKETFADFEFLGFYVSGNHEQIIEDDIRLQRQALNYTESPFLLKFNVFSPVVSDKVSISVFESTFDPVNENNLLFHPINVKIVSEMAEQIGLDHVARYSKTNAVSESTISKQMGAQFGAINTFIQGITIAKAYVKAVQNGQLESDAYILKEINKLCFKLSVHSEKSKNQCSRDNLQNSDHKLLVLLSAFCSVQGSMYQLIDKVNILSREYGHRERSSFLQLFSSSMGDGGKVLPPPGTHLPRFFF